MMVNIDFYQLPSPSPSTTTTSASTSTTTTTTTTYCCYTSLLHTLHKHLSTLLYPTDLLINRNSRKLANVSFILQYDFTWLMLFSANFKYLSSKFEIKLFCIEF